MKFKNTIVFAAMLAMGVSTFAVEEAAETPVKKSKEGGIRVTLGTSPGWNEFDVGGAAIEIDEEMGAQIEVLFQSRYWRDDQSTLSGTFGWGFFFASNGGEVSVDDGFGGTDTLEFDTGAFGLMAQGGLAGKLGDRFVYEVLPYAGIGAASTEVAISGSFNGEDDGSGLYLMFGIKAGMYFKLTEKVELGGEVGYQLHSVDVAVETLDDWELSGDGASGALVVNIVL